MLRYDLLIVKSWKFSRCSTVFKIHLPKYFKLIIQVKQLAQLVASFTAGMQRINWSTIGSFMGRAPRVCRDKWDSLVQSAIPIGPYTPEEDALILRRVSEWGNNGNGLWVSLQNEMGRSSSSLNGRWRTLKKRKERCDAIG